MIDTHRNVSDSSVPIELIFFVIGMFGFFPAEASDVVGSAADSAGPVSYFLKLNRVGRLVGALSLVENRVRRSAAMAHSEPIFLFRVEGLSVPVELRIAHQTQR